jgi:hypothetical protein
MLTFTRGVPSELELQLYHQVHRKLLDKAVILRRNWRSNFSKSLQPTSIKRSKFDKRLTGAVKEWIIQNTTPSSNTRNVINFRDDNGNKVKQVTHWRTSSLNKMYERCKLEVPSQLGKDDLSFSKSYFYNNIPPYVRMKRHQEGLCPMHSTGHAYHKEMLRKRDQWHDKCTCKCNFCLPTGCNHGKAPADGECSKFTCTRCAGVHCPRESNKTFTEWTYPVQKKRDGGGLYWENVAEHGTRQEFSNVVREEMKAFVQHDTHNIWHKKQMAKLLNELPVGEVVVKCDYIQNINHSRGRETSSAYYGKRQTQFLSMVVWYNKVNADGSVTKYKAYYDYLSSYLKHNSLFFQKSMLHLLTHLRDEVGVDIKKV